VCFGGGLNRVGLAWAALLIVASLLHLLLPSLSRVLAVVPLLSSFSFGLHPALLPLCLQHLHLALIIRGRPFPGLPPTCMNAVELLLETVRSVISGLRGLASSLEAGLHQYEAAQSAALVDFDLESARSAITHRSPPASPGVSFASTSRSAYCQVASSITDPPAYCFDFCSSLSGSPAEVEQRVRRAWEAGVWAKATLDGRIDKPRPTPKLRIKPAVYIVVRAPGVHHPVRVATATEFFRLVPAFTESTISHSFPSIGEGKVYCAALGIRFPDLQQ